MPPAFPDSGPRTVLEADLRLEDALRRVLGFGAAFVPHALDRRFIVRLQRAIEDGPFETPPQVVGPVRQETEVYRISPGTIPESDHLRRALTRAVRAQSAGTRGLATWRPNDVQVQRYRPGGLGITPHLDGKRFRRLVAIFTTRGTARFAICRDRSGEVLEEWAAAPGSLILLRGPGLGGVRDGRPFHLVRGPRRGWRYSISYRMIDRKEHPRST